jgi:ABC-type dipeptide/oligopeptide/nickel transport system ATPase component
MSDQQASHDKQLEEGNWTVDVKKQTLEQNRFDELTWNNIDGKNVPLLRRHAVNGIIKQILVHNNNNQYTGCLAIGKSGSGKTTLTKRIMHGIHTAPEEWKLPSEYQFHWFTGEDMFKMPKIIKSLTQGVNHFIVFDDASYTLEDASKTEMAVLANALTKIRHDVKGKCIVWMNIHYSKATKKFFRDVDFQFATSYTPNDRQNLIDIFGSDRAVDTFANLYKTSSRHGWFRVPYQGTKELIYTISKPFRPVLVMDTYTHLTLVNRDECEMCGKDPYNKDYKEPIPAEEVVKTLQKMSKQHRMSTNTLRAWVYMREGNLMNLSPTARGMWKWMSKVSESINCDWSEVLKLYVDGLQNNIKVKKHETQEIKDAKADFDKFVEEHDEQD